LSRFVEKLVSNPTSASEKFDLSFKVVVNQAVINKLEDLNFFLGQLNFRTFIVLLRLLLVRENRT
jgi:hypothetical protein